MRKAGGGGVSGEKKRVSGQEETHFDITLVERAVRGHQRVMNAVSRLKTVIV